MEPIDTDFDYVASRIGQSARRAELNEQGLVVVSLCFRQRPSDVLVRNGLDGVVNRDLEHFRGSQAGPEQ